MPNRSASRYVPLLVLVVFAAALGAAFGPRMYQSYLFRRTCNAMLAEVRAGNMSAVAAYIEPSQQQSAQQLFALIPAGLTQQIESLSIYRAERLRSGAIEAVVSCKVAAGDLDAPYQGRLYWRWDRGRWWWDFDSTLYAAWPMSGEPDWRDISNIVSEAAEAYN
jgi:hypothetical protein